MRQFGSEASLQHPGIYLPPLAGAVAIALLIGLRIAGIQAPWVQGIAFVVALSLLGFAFLDMLVRDVRRTHLHPIRRRATVLAVMVLESILLFAATYLSIAEYADQISGMSTPLDSVYFTMTTLMTIGFGDIAAQGQLARGVVLVQMIFTVLLLSASVRLLSSLTRELTKEAGHDGRR